MTEFAEVDLPALDYTEPALRGPRFHTRMRELREQGWLATTQLGVVVLDHESAEFFLRSRATTFPGPKLAELFGITEGPLAEELRRNILCIDGADHQRLRTLVNPTFTPRAVGRWRPAMRGFLAQLWEPLSGGGRCDVVESLCRPYPALTIAAVMGAPLADAPRLHHWSHWIQKQFSAEALLGERASIERAVEEFYGYAGDLLASRRARPGDDLISQLLAAEAEGHRLSDVELVNLVLNVLVGGVDTTQAQLAHTLRLLADHPDQWAALRADPGLAAGAVAEALRVEPITPFTARIVVERVEHRGVAFPAGTVVLVASAAANRTGVADPDRFDITRTATRHVTFGAGSHYCLGANLATAELHEALVFLAARVRRLEPDGEPAFGGVTGIYGLDTLPMRITPSGDEPVPTDPAAPHSTVD